MTEISINGIVFKIGDGLQAPSLIFAALQQALGCQHKARLQVQVQRAGDERWYDFGVIGTADLPESRPAEVNVLAAAVFPETFSAEALAGKTVTNQLMFAEERSSDEERMRQTVELLETQQAIADGQPVASKYDGVQIHASVKIYDPVVFTKTRDERGRPNIWIGEGARIDSFTKIEGGVSVCIGKNVHVASYAHLNIGGGTLFIDNGAAIASGVRIITGGNAPDAKSASAVAPLDEQVLHSARVSIQSDACVYAGAIILPNVSIGSGARVAAGAVVTKNVPPYEIWAGNPARFIRRRTDEIARRYFAGGWRDGGQQS